MKMKGRDYRRFISIKDLTAALPLYSSSVGVVSSRTFSLCSSPSLVSQCDNWSALRFHLRPDPEKGTLPLGAWSKILREDYKDSRRGGIDGDFDEEEESDGRIPHEFLARQLASMRISSFSLHKGVGSLKGRDLSRVRDLGESWV
ncbi:hypothetical protein AAC387_Pa04g0901 [Persea americana]